MLWLKYLLFAILLGLVLKYTPLFGLEDDNIIRFVILAVIILIVVELFLPNTEAMENMSVPQGQLSGAVGANLHDVTCPEDVVQLESQCPSPASPEDVNSTQIQGAGYYLLNNGVYSESGSEIQNEEQLLCH